ncbi:MAG: hypothetical protein LUH19_01270 [Lachnospiraceae bacterium]|nr:hypothetical protein [Lachnospiraceae bacterium]
MGAVINRWIAWIKGHNAWKAVVLLEGMILCILLANCFRGRCDYTFGTDNLSVSGTYVWKGEDENGESVFCAASEEEVDGEVILSTGKLKFYPGAYNIRINYHSQVNYIEESSMETGLSYLNLESASNSVFFDFERLLLRDGLTSAEQTVQITSPWAVGDLELTVTFYGYGELTVSSIEVEEIVAYRYISFLGIFMLFILGDLFCFLVFSDREFLYGKELGVLAMICGAAVIPFMADWTYWGHDIGFHVNRILLLAQELMRGNYFPAILTDAMNGYGYPAPLFYGEIFLYIPAALYCCGFGLTSVYNIYICMISVSTCLIMYYCALKIFKKTNVALLASAMYTFSAVRLTNIFVRSAVGEYTAQTFLPLLFLGFYNIYAAPKGEKLTLRSYWPIVAGLTAIFSCHTLSLEMSAMIILLFCLIFIRKTLEPQRFLALVKAALFSFLVNLAFLVVMLDSLGMDMYVSNQMGGQIQSHGADLIQILNSVVNGYQLNEFTDTAAEEMSLSIGFSVTFGLVLFLICLARQKKMGCQDQQNRKVAAVSWGFCVLMIFLSSGYMCYDYLDFLPEQLYDLLVVYQFPWRWLPFATLFGVFCTAAVVNSAEMEGVFGRTSVTWLLGLILVINTGQIYADQLRTADLNKFDNNIYRYATWVGGENVLWQTDLAGIAYRDLLYDDSGLAVGEYSTEDGRYLLYDVENTSDTVAFVDIPLFNYDNYVAYDTQTGETISITNGSNNRIRLNIPADYSGTIEVKYLIPLLWKIAGAVSVITDVLLAGYLLLQMRKKNPVVEAGDCGIRGHRRAAGGVCTSAQEKNRGTAKSRLILEILRFL